MKVYVVTTGQAVYEDNVTVIGVYKEFENALNKVQQESLISKDNSKWDDYWYDVEEWEVK